MVSNPFAAVIGQPQAVTLLSQAIDRDRIAPAYLFAGVPGVGRSLTARCFATRLLQRSTQDDRVLQQRIQQGNHPDLLWVEPTYLHQGKRVSATEAADLGIKRKTAPQIRLEQIREIGQFLSRPPLEAARSIVVIEQAETMAEPAANGLLKTLEEPGRATIILLAPGVESLLPTLVSRCQIIPFQRLSPDAIAQILQQNYAELLQSPEVLALAQGSVSSAIAGWQQLQVIPAELRTDLMQPPRSTRHALELARQVAQLELETQLWLIDYLQQHYWQQTRQPWLLQPLETARQALQAFAQARLVWEVTLLAIAPA